METSLGLQLLTQLRQRGIGLSVDHTAHEAERRRITARLPASSVGAGGDLSAISATPKEFLHKRLADPKHSSDSPLGAEPLVTGAEDLLSKVKRIGFHACERNPSTPYIQLRTAIGLQGQPVPELQAQRATDRQALPFPIQPNLGEESLH
jgi:hypothetical protein